jgi:hypothetical protein
MNQSSQLAMALGVFHYQCDKCGKRVFYKPTPLGDSHDISS